MIFSRIAAVESFLPEKIVTNHELSSSLQTSHDWIVKRTGIHTRHLASVNEDSLSMSLAATRKLLEKTSHSASTISAVIVATSTPNQAMPSIACQLCNLLGIDTAFSLDINAACSGFLYALSVANDRIKYHDEDVVLVVGVDTMSRITNWQDRSTAVLFGDGAGAALLVRSAEPGIRFVHCSSESIGADLLKTTKYKSNGSPCQLTMQGKEVFRFAVDRLSQGTKSVLKKHHIATNSIDLVIPHQANTRILDQVTKFLNLERAKVVKTLQDHANTSAASIPLALCTADHNGFLASGSRVLFNAFGAGFTWGVAVCDF